MIATGSDPVIPPVPGLDELEGVWTNRGVTALTEVPRRLLVLGGGPVGVEMAQAVRRMGASVALVEGADHVLPREPKPLGEALAVALAADGIELHLGEHASRRPPRRRRVRRSSSPGAMSFAGDRLLVATGRRARVGGLGLDTVGVEPTRQGIPVDERMRAGERLWAIGDVTGVWPLTYVGKYQGRVAAENILGRDRTASYDAVPRVVFTDPQAASVGEPEGLMSATVRLAEVPRTSTYTRAYAESPGFMTLVSDGERLTGAYALGPEAGEWLQQATVAIRARVPLSVLFDVIQPFPSFSEAFLSTLSDLEAQTAGVLPGRCTDKGEPTMDVATLADLLRETSEHHDPYEKASPEHNWWDWYAAYLNARLEGAHRRRRPGRPASTWRASWEFAEYLRASPQSGEFGKATSLVAEADASHRCHGRPGRAVRCPRARRVSGPRLRLLPIRSPPRPKRTARACRHSHPARRSSPGDRCPALPQPAYRGVAPAQGVHQARDPLTSRAGPSASRLRLRAAPGLSSRVRKRVDHAPSERAFEVAVGVEPERLEPGPLRLLRGTPEQLAKIVQGRPKLAVGGQRDLVDI